MNEIWTMNKSWRVSESSRVNRMLNCEWKVGDEIKVEQWKKLGQIIKAER